jgi:hypothetical protein
LLKKRTRIALCAVASISLGLVATTTASAGANGPSKPAPWANGPVVRAFIKTVGANVIRNQNTLSLYRAWMLTQPGFARSGYVGSIDHLAHKATTIMWAGPRTALLAKIIAEGQRRGIKVSVQHRRESLQQLDAAINAIYRQAARGEWRGFKISGIAAVGAKDTGLTVDGTYTSGPAARRAPQVKALHTVISGVRVRVVPGVAATLLIGRDNDTAPFDAGGLMEDTGHTDICSSGFAIEYQGAPHTTTARHCVAVGQWHDISVPTTFYGPNGTDSPNGGAMVLSASGIAEAWDGAYNSVNFAKAVIGYEDLALGDLVCTGGGNSGEHCMIQVQNLLYTLGDGFGPAFHTIVGVHEQSGKIAAVTGDSGGPVISLAGTASGQVRAAGMIQAALGPPVGPPLLTGASGCGPAFTYSLGSQQAQCGTTIAFSSMRTIVGSLPGASLLTA